MIRKTTLRTMGGSPGAALPEDLAERLQVEAGDKLLLLETDDGVLLTALDPELKRSEDAYERVAGKFRSALRELAG